MEIVFDEHKRVANFEKHGFDFAGLDQAFFERALVIDAKSERLMAIGRFDDAIISVIFRPLGLEAISIVSMRTASFKERARL
jgi:uncharacterized protein